MYLEVKHKAGYMEISMYLAVKHKARYMEISMYLARIHVHCSCILCFARIHRVQPRLMRLWNLSLSSLLK